MNKTKDISQKMRFYPKDYPSFEHEPLQTDFKIVAFSDNVGEGIISLKEFVEGDIVFRFTGKMLSKITQYSLQISKDLHIEDPIVMGKVLHSCNPNMRVDMKTQTFYALSDIKRGDILSMDYEETEDILYRTFHCKCQNDNCRGLIRGKRYQ